MTLYLWVTNDKLAKLYGTAPRWRREYLLTNAIVSVLLFTAGFMMSAGFGDPGSVEKYFCASNSVPIDQSDGATICEAQSVVLDYASLALTYSWFAVSVDLYLKIIKGRKSTNKYFWTYMALIHAPAVFFVGMLAVGEQLGYDGTSSVCAYTTPRLRRSRTYLLYPIDISIFLCTTGGPALLAICSRRYFHIWRMFRTKLQRHNDSSDSNRRESFRQAPQLLAALFHDGKGHNINSAGNLLSGRILPLHGNRSLADDQPPNQPLPHEEALMVPHSLTTMAVQPSPQLVLQQGSPARPSFKSGRFGAAAVAPTGGGGGVAAANAENKSLPITMTGVDLSHPSATLQEPILLPPYCDARMGLVSGNPESRATVTSITSIRNALEVLYMPLFGATTFQLLVLVYIIAIRSQLYFGIDEAKHSYEIWERCVIKHYDGASDASWQHVCGLQPSYNAKNFRIALFFISNVGFAAQPILSRRTYCHCSYVAGSYI